MPTLALEICQLLVQARALGVVALGVVALGVVALGVVALGVVALGVEVAPGLPARCSQASVALLLVLDLFKVFLPSNLL